MCAVATNGEETSVYPTPQRLLHYTLRFPSSGRPLVKIAVMPIFSGQKKSGNERSPRHTPGAGPGGGGGIPKKKAGATPPLPAPPALATNNPSRPTPGSGSRRGVVPSRQELVFHCQLAHGSPTREIKDFSNVKELYARIAAAFELTTDQVCPYHPYPHSPTHTH